MIWYGDTDTLVGYGTFLHLPENLLKSKIQPVAPFISSSVQGLATELNLLHQREISRIGEFQIRPFLPLQRGNELWEQKVKWIAGSRWWPFMSWCQLEHFLGGTWRRWKMRDGPNMMVMMASMIFLSLNISSIPHCASRFLRAYDGTIAFHLSDLSTLGFESFGAIFFSGAVALAMHMKMTAGSTCFKGACFPGSLLTPWRREELCWPSPAFRSQVDQLFVGFSKSMFAIFFLWI